MVVIYITLFRRAAVPQGVNALVSHIFMTKSKLAPGQREFYCETTRKLFLLAGEQSDADRSNNQLIKSTRISPWRVPERLFNFLPPFEKYTKQTVLAHRYVRHRQHKNPSTAVSIRSGSTLSSWLGKLVKTRDHESSFSADPQTLYQFFDPFLRSNSVRGML